MSIFEPNYIQHRRSKPGVAIQLEINTNQPLTSQSIVELAALVSAIEDYFDALPIPDQPAGGAG